MNKAVLKVYPSSFWHGDVVMIGNKEGLTKLKEAIEVALSGTRGNAIVEETDGNHYHVYSKMFTGDLLDEDYKNLPLHYDDDLQITSEEQNLLSKFLCNEEELEKRL